jgi:hypothetical protein
MTTFQELEKIKYAVAHWSESIGAELCNNVVVLSTSSLINARIMASEFMKLYRDGIKSESFLFALNMRITDDSLYQSFRGCQTPEQLRSCFIGQGMPCTSESNLIRDHVENLLSQIVKKVSIPQGLADEIKNAEEKMKTLAICEMTTAVLEARRAGMPEKNMLLLLQSIQEGVFPPIPQ